VLAYWFLKTPVTTSPVEAVQLQAQADAKDDKSWLRRLYDPTLRWSLGKPWIVVALAFVLFLGTLAMTPLLKTNFLGATGQNTLTVSQDLEAGASLERQDEAARKVEDLLGDVDGIKNVQTTVGGGGLMALMGGGSTSFAVTLDEEVDADAKSAEVRTALTDADGDVTVAAGDGGFSSALEVVVTATDQGNLIDAAEQVEEELKTIDDIGEVTSDSSPAQPILAV